VFFASSDNGESWRQVGEIVTPLPHQNVQPSAVEGVDGRILCIMRNTGQGWLWYAESSDAGRSWSTAADAGFANPGSPAMLLRLASGNLALIWNDSTTRRAPLVIALSADDGQTWTPGRVLADGAGAYSYPGAIQTVDGVVHIVLSDDRQFIREIAVNEAWVVAGDP
jgi:predicted neuraminidase